MRIQRYKRTHHLRGLRGPPLYCYGVMECIAGVYIGGFEVGNRKPVLCHATPSTPGNAEAVEVQLAVPKHRLNTTTRETRVGGHLMRSDCLVYRNPRVSASQSRANIRSSKTSSRALERSASNVEVYYSRYKKCS